jgi:hypothetical protein
MAYVKEPDGSYTFVPDKPIVVTAKPTYAVYVIPALIIIGLYILTKKK